MLSNKIKALFKFIEFLHSNIDNFKQYDKLWDEINSLFVYFEPELKRFETKCVTIKTKAELKQVLMKESEFDEYVNVYAANLKGLTKQNVNNVFEANYKRFKYYKSDWVTNNGVYLKTTLERWLHTLPGKNSDGQKISNLGHVVCSDTIKGIPITKEMFAECVLEYHKKQKEKLTIGLNTDKIVKNEQLKIYIQFLENYLKPNNNPEALPPQPIIESPFSVLQWATIFYYADETKLLSESRLLKTRLEQFMSKHQVNTTPVNFKNSYYEAKRRINEKNDYPINKLELIIPFLKENYKQTVTKVDNDIIFLKENKPDY